MLFSNHAPPANLEDLVGRIAPRPVFFIYGEHDQANVRELTPSYYEAARAPKQLWEVAGASHTGGIDARPAAYERRVVGFLDRALLSPGRGPSTSRDTRNPALERQVSSLGETHSPRGA